MRANAEFVAVGVATGAPEGGGAGVALKISSRWPEAPKHLRQFTRGNKFQGGDLFVVAPGKNRPGVIYMATLPEAGQQATSSFLNRGLRKLARYCIKHKVESVALSKTGTGLDWESEALPLIEKFLEGEETMFYIYEEAKRERAEKTSPLI